jgi:glycerol-3-phosphate dehydrogenase
LQDLLIIGGGINGVGIARDASGRGLKVTLIEKGDLASKTSSWSTKLIHGGIRYLENYEFRLVRESLKEREVIRKIAPHITKPIRFVLPHVPSLRPTWLIRLGLILYDWMGGVITLPKSKVINLENDYDENPIKSDYKKGYEYSDLFVDDARLVLLNAQDAISKGAKIYTNANIQKVIRKRDNWEVFLNNGEVLYSKVIINASGPYALDVLNNLIGIQSQKKIRHVQGSHIITEKLYKGEQAYILQLDDKRIIFLIPYLDKYTLIGTTDHEVKSYDNPKITDIEKKYLISSVNKFIKNKITEDNIIWTYSGVRPLVEDLNENASKITRDYTFEIDDKDAPILTVFGGKLTTFRKLSEHALDKISKYIKISNKSWTGNEILPGGEKTTDLNFLIPEGILPRLIKTYGHKITKLNQYYQGFNDGGEHIFNDLYEFEIKYLVLEEMAKTSEDILFRRTKLGINFPKEKLPNLENILKKYL